MLLGKLSPDVTVDDVTDILQTVSLKQDANWWCYDWILEAIPVSTVNNLSSTFLPPAGPGLEWHHSTTSGHSRKGLGGWL